jgi:hypothetical protein
MARQRARITGSVDPLEIVPLIHFQTKCMPVTALYCPLMMYAHVFLYRCRVCGRPLVWLRVNDSTIYTNKKDLEIGPEAVSLSCECGRHYRQRHSPQQGDEVITSWEGTKPFSVQLSPTIGLEAQI